MAPLVALEPVLLMLLSIPVVMFYRIWPMEGTPYWLFGMLFVILFANVLFTIYPELLPKKTLAPVLRKVFLIAALVIVIGGATWTRIADRHKHGPELGVHDIILQQEAAMRYLLVGKNPYKETYFGTPMEKWHYAELGYDAVNPALYHFVMPPWYLLFPYPFYFLMGHTIGYFDARIVLLFCLSGTLFILWQWFKNKSLGTMAIILTALAPGIVDYFIEGRSDAFVLFWLVWALYLLDLKKYALSAAVFALAFLSKQTIWFAVPFYFVYLWLGLKKNFQKTLPYVLIFGGVVGILTLPFLLWDPKAFIDSVVLYLSGGTAHGYPVSGYGLGMLLYEFKVISDIHAYYPFISWQASLGIPTLAATLIWLGKKISISRMLIMYGITLFVIWYTSRYFNNSHLAYLASIFMLGILKDLDERPNHET